MKKAVFLWMGLLSWVFASAQLTSSDCLEELEQVYAHIDHTALLSGTQAVSLQFQHSYVMRLDPEGKTVEMAETKTYGPNFFLHECEEFLDVSDATEAFNWRKPQFLIYRTKPTLNKCAFIPDTDKGILGYAMVKICEFVPAPGHDTLRYKRAFFVLNDEGQKRYKLKDMEIVWNPLNQMPVSIMANFTEKSNWKWSRYAFTQIGAPKEPLPANAKDVLLDEAGEIKGRARGSELLDYR